MQVRLEQLDVRKIRSRHGDAVRIVECMRELEGLLQVMTHRRVFTRDAGEHRTAVVHLEERERRRVACSGQHCIDDGEAFARVPVDVPEDA